jgi:hypothetical protein
MNTKMFNTSINYDNIMKIKHYYKIPKEEFVKLYVLTKEDVEEINDTLKLCINMNRDDATKLYLHKIYEDSRFLNNEYRENVKKMLNYIDESHKNMSHTC